MKRRQVLSLSMAGVVSPSIWGQASKWGEAEGYPSGWGNPRSFLFRTQTRVGNYSGGYEKMFRTRIIKAPPLPSELTTGSTERVINYRRNFSTRSIDEYINENPITGMLIARRGKVLFERYQMKRNANMRFTGWSMSKSITSLLLGIAIDKGAIHSIDDTVSKYTKELIDANCGRITLRNLLNMTTGLQLTGDLLKDNESYYPDGFLKDDSDLSAVLKVPRQVGQQGERYLYNDLSTLVLGQVIRSAVGKSLAEFCEEALWSQLGAEADAAWLTDSRGLEFNCIGFSARLRDWVRVGQLIAQKGYMNGRQIISESWINECTTWGEKDKVTRVGALWGRADGYKAYFRHARSDGSRPEMHGFHGQRLLIDMVTQTVIVQTAVDHGNWLSELNSIFDAAVALPD